MVPGFSDTRTARFVDPPPSESRLLSKYKNPATSNYDFDDKKSTYFAQDGDSAFVLTSQVRQEPIWTPEVLQVRQQELLKRLSAVWDLDRIAKTLSVDPGNSGEG